MAENSAPYAPTKAVMTAIIRYRDRGLPSPLDTSGLEQIGIASTMAPRTLAALKFLGLIDEESGKTTEAFDRIKRASTEEYPGQLAEVVQAAYLPVFSIVNPAEDGDVALADAFRRFEPANQRGKMVSLFRGLCMEAGILPVVKRQRGGGKPRPGSNGQQRVAKVPRSEPPPRPDPSPAPADHIDRALIAAIIQQLPREARWTAARREKWLQTLTSAVDLLIEIEPGHPPTGGDS